MASGLSKILVFGGTGYLGKYIVKASIKMGHPTFVYGRPINPNTKPSKVELHKEFQSMGVTIIQGELTEHEKLVSIIKQIDVVISVLGAPLLLLFFFFLLNVIAGNVRFIPSDFGCEEERITALPPFQAYLDNRKKIRRATEATGTPFTFVSSTCFGAYFINFLFHSHDQQSGELTIYGSASGQAKELAIELSSIGLQETLSQLDLVSLWEKKTARYFKKVYVSDEEIVKLSETSEHPHNVRATILHSIFVKGGMTNFELSEDDFEVSKLYPDFDYTTVDHPIDVFLC
ncbi:hypothetical protein ACSBR2_017394 [Camellia fascicularis]